jgi:hypothetical protein
MFGLSIDSSYVMVIKRAKFYMVFDHVQDSRRGIPMKKCITVLFLFNLTLCFKCKQATGPEKPGVGQYNLYVSPIGDDSNSGKSWKSALRSISHANSIMQSNFKKQRTIFLASGTFSAILTGEKFPIKLKPNVFIEGSGSDSTFITGNGHDLLFHNVVVEGSAVQESNDAQGVKISNCTIENASTAIGNEDAVFRVEHDDAFCVFENLVIRNCTDGIGGLRSDIHVLSCLFQNCQSGVSCGFCGIKLENVKIFNCQTGIYVGAGLGTLENVLIHDCENGVHVANSQLDGVNCTITGSKYYGVEGYDTSTIKFLNSIIYGNILIQVYIPFDSWLSGNNKLNVSYTDIQNGKAGVNGHPDNIQFGVGMIDLEPKFVDPANNDYHLSSDSSCRDAGNPDTQYNDADGSRNDLGAYGGPKGNLF